MNEHEIFMIRQEIGELNRTIDRINRKSDKWLKDNKDMIDELKMDIQENTSVMMDLANAIDRAFKVVINIRED